MFKPIRSITRAATRKPGEPLNVLCCPTHEAYETNLCKTGHNFYAFRCDMVKDWDLNYRALPKNYVLLNRNLGQNQLPVEVDFDVVLSQNKFGQFKILSQFAQKLQIPLISLEHCLPVPEWNEPYLQALKSMKGDLNLFISEFSRGKWLWDNDDDESMVIHHGIDTDFFCPNEVMVKKSEEVYGLSVVNDWINRSWCCGYDFWKEATKNVKTKVVGKTPGLSEPAKSVHELLRAYRKANYFINTSLISPIPTAVLEAMACGLPVVSTKTCMLPEIIQDGHNGFLCETPYEFEMACEFLVKNEDARQKMGAAARETVLEMFSLSKFVSSWNNVFEIASQIIVK